ncbi:Retrovirus-related Pol polyprotein from transposon RE1 [Linum perenne]
MLVNFQMVNMKSSATLMAPNLKLDDDSSSTLANQKKCRGMIGSLLYLTASRQDIQFSVCICARLQASPKNSHHSAVKQIFR